MTTFFIFFQKQTNVVDKLKAIAKIICVSYYGTNNHIILDTFGDYFNWYVDSDLCS